VALVALVAFVAFVALVAFVAFVAVAEFPEHDAAVVALVALVAVAALPVQEPDDPVVFWFSVGNVQLARFPELGVPKAGVTNVGLVANTLEPVPVSSVKTAAKLALDGVAKNVATLEAKPLTPVLTGRPVQFVNVPLAGVPSAGVTNVGLIKSAFVATAIAMLANSVLISVPLRIFRGSPEVSASLVAKFVLCV
jgi:hypothetical protein